MSQGDWKEVVHPRNGNILDTKMAINSLREFRVIENGWGDSKRQEGCQHSHGEPRCNRFSRTQREG